MEHRKNGMKQKTFHTSQSLTDARACMCHVALRLECHQFTCPEMGRNNSAMAMTAIKFGSPFLAKVYLFNQLCAECTWTSKHVAAVVVNAFPFDQIEHLFAFNNRRAQFNAIKWNEIKMRSRVFFSTFIT